MPIVSQKPYYDQDGIRVFWTDCRDFVPVVPYDFIFADPPFNIGQAYEGYKDNLTRDAYEQFTATWVDHVWKLCDGVMALHGPDDLVGLYLQAARSLKMTRIAWINWHYRFGQCNRTNWIDARCHCLIYARGNCPGWTFTFNEEEVLVESDRASKYGDTRVDDTERGGMRLPGTVWGVPSDGPYWGRVQGNNKERVEGCPNQLPEVYLERLIRAYTNPGDRILDPFGGSGTTAVVAKALGRKCDTLDVGEACCESISKRLERGAVRC